MTLAIYNMKTPTFKKNKIEKHLQKIQEFETKRFNRYKHHGEKELKIFKEFHDNCIQMNNIVEPIIVDTINHDDFFESQQDDD